jgi:hypothetical protein
MFERTRQSWLNVLARISGRKGVPAQKRKPSGFRPMAEILEDRLAPATITVTSFADNLTAGDGRVTLREAIQAHNNHSTGGNPDFTAATLSGTFGNDVIVFAPTVFATARTITLTGGTLSISQSLGSLSIVGPNAGLTIDGNNACTILTVNWGATASLSGLTITHGYQSNVGNSGGINNSGTLTVSNCTFADNNTGVLGHTGNGGGICNEDGTLIVNDCTFDDNFAGYSGGGVSSFNGPLSVSNSTFYDNTSGRGGGIYSQNGSLTVTNCTLTDNQSSGITAFGFEEDPEDPITITLNGNIIVGNFNHAGGTAADVTTELEEITLAGSNNLIGTGGSGGLTNGVNGNQVGVSLADAGLGALGNNGGPTPTMALLPGSFALGRGITATTATFDQRGVARPINAPGDVGAFQHPMIAKLEFVPGPRQARAGAVVPALAVQLADVNNSAVAQPGVTIYLAVYSGNTLVTMLVATTGENGLATFNNLKLKVAGRYTLKARSGGLTVASVPFVVLPSPKQGRIG